MQRIELIRDEYNKMVALHEGKDEDKELEKWLADIFDENGYEPETLMSTDGCSDVFEAISYY